jgi:hypothetical protein
LGQRSDVWVLREIWLSGHVTIEDGWVKRRSARVDSGTVDELVESGVLSSGGAGGIRKRPGKKTYDIELKHVAADALVLHLVSASRASQDGTFKAGAELSKSVN